MPEGTLALAEIGPWISMSLLVDGWPVLASGGDLVWARGFPVAAEFAASERTQAGILIAEERI